jgi:hypothetical protein
MGVQRVLFIAAPRPLAAENFRLQASDYTPVIAGLDAVLPKASVAVVVNSANRTGASLPSAPEGGGGLLLAERRPESTWPWHGGCLLRERGGEGLP